MRKLGILLLVIVSSVARVSISEDYPDPPPDAPINPPVEKKCMKCTGTANCSVDICTRNSQYPYCYDAAAAPTPGKICEKTKEETDKCTISKLVICGLIIEHNCPFRTVDCTGTIHKKYWRRVPGCVP